MKDIPDSRCKVRKTQGDFDRACDLGYGINLYGCTRDEMWLIMPASPSYLKFLAERDGFVVLTDAEVR